MTKYFKNTPDGTRDLLFEECVIRRAVENKINSVFRSRGFSEVITPGIEFIDVFSLKSRIIPPESMYKLIDTKGRIIVLRPDSTVPIARLAATRLKDQPLPLRLFYNQSVFVINRAMSGRSDEVVQAGIEIIGSDSKKADLEVITIAIESLEACRLDDFRIEIGHIGLFNTLVSKLNLSDEAVERLRALIEIKNYPMLVSELDKIGAGKEIEALKQLPRLFGGESVFEKAAELFDDADCLELLNYLKEIYTSLAALGLDNKITLDLGIVNRTDYYTGVVFRGYIAGSGETVLSGGRYDSLVGQFGTDAPATGFAINIDEVAGALLSMQEISLKAPDVLIFAEDGYEIEALKYRQALIKQGLVTEYCLFDSRSEALNYAQRKGIGRVDVVSQQVESLAAVNKR